MPTPKTTGLSGADNGSIEARLARLEDLEAIRNLKQRYAFFVDAGFDADGFAGLFTDNGVWESDRFGTYRGRAAIREFMVGVKDQLKWVIHFATSAVIDIAADGNSAQGTWYLFEPASMVIDHSVEAVLITGRYHDDLTKVDGVWMFSHVRVNFETMCRWTDSWVPRPFLDD